MAQIFSPAANTVAKVSLVVGGVAPLVVGLGIAALSRSSFNTKVDVPLNQPVPFSHQHHAWELGIDCRYCHWPVEKSPYAGIPSTEVCMSCHSQVWTNSPLLEPVRQSYATNTPLQWNLVNKLPDFVFFNHSIHVNRGINCNICHGPVNEMTITYKGEPFQMVWCLQCHRAPQRYLYRDPQYPNLTPRQQVFNLYWKLQERGYAGLTSHERDILAGGYDGSDNPTRVAEGEKLVNEYGVKVQQLTDCSVCHH